MTPFYSSLSLTAELVTFLVYNKMHDKGSLFSCKRREFIFISIMAGKTRQQEREATGHIISVVKTQRDKC